MIGSKSDAKSGFFNRNRVYDAALAAEREVFSKFGAFVRQRARTSMKRTKKVSEPGKPPAAHAGQLKEMLYFSYDFGSRSVVIGPVVFRAGVAPKLLEEGGTAESKGQTLRYRPRLFMRPAFEAERPKVAELWKNAVK